MAHTIRLTDLTKDLMDVAANPRKYSESMIRGLLWDAAEILFLQGLDVASDPSTIEFEYSDDGGWSLTWPAWPATT